MATEVTSRQRQALKARAHALEPVVTIGGAGLTPGVRRELDAALTVHELIKVRVGGDDRDQRASLLAEICEQTGAAAVGKVGKILILWRERPAEG
jgi:putative YhbY family RNA-binding protein